MRETMARCINEATDKMLKAGVDAEGAGPDGLLLFEKVNPIDENSPWQAVFITEYDSIKSFVATANSFAIPFTIHMQGDLKWHAAALGKDGASPHWCWLCMIAHWERQNKLRTEGGQPFVGEPWTLAEIKRVVEEERTGAAALGVKQAPMTERLGPDRCELPVLHLLLGIGNDLLDDMINYVEERNCLERTFGQYSANAVAAIEPQQKEACKNCCEAAGVLDDKTEAVAEWDATNGAPLSTLKATKHDCVQELKVLQPRTGQAWKDLDKKRNGHLVQIRELNEKRDALKKEEKLASDLLNQKRVALGLVLKEEDKLHRIETRIDKEAFCPFQIERPAMHGGKFPGPDLRFCMGNATPAFAIIDKIATEEAATNRMCDEGLEDCKQFIELARDAMILFDAHFALLNAPASEMATEEAKLRIRAQARSCLSHAIDLLHALGCSTAPKVHAAWAHSIVRIPVPGESEQWIELLHQMRLKHASRLKGMRDRPRRFQIENNWEAGCRAADTKSIQASVHDKTKQSAGEKEKRASSRVSERAAGPSEAASTGDDGSKRVKMTTQDERVAQREATLERWRQQAIPNVPTAKDLNAKCLEQEPKQLQQQQQHRIYFSLLCIAIVGRCSVQHTRKILHNDPRCASTMTAIEKDVVQLTLFCHCDVVPSHRAMQSFELCKHT